MNKAESSNTTAETRRTRSLSRGFVDLTLRINQNLDFAFDVVIVGSGYGGSVAAQQLAGLHREDGRPLTVCVLERGAEYLPGMFPSAFSDLPTHVRYGAQATGNVTGNHEGLFDVRLGADVSALVANGLGGGSLINAGVMLAPDFNSFSSKLPVNVQTDLTGTYLADARKLLLGTPLAVAVPNAVTPSSLYSGIGNLPAYPLKFQRLSDLGKGSGLPSQAADISVAMVDQAPNPYSVNLNACNACGDCMTGCNVGAKASLDTNLLAQAKNNGAEIYTGASVLKLCRINVSTPSAATLWQLDVVHTSHVLRRREPHSLRLKAHKVILAAGTLGSPEILLRSRSDKLVFSNKLGEQFSCNGDNIATIHKLPSDAHSTDDEFKALGDRRVGPTITNMVKVPADSRGLGFWIQEFAVPAPLKRLFSEIVTTANSLVQMASYDTEKHGGESLTAVDTCAVDEKAIEKTLLVGLIGHDSAEGSLRQPLQSTKNHYSEQEGTLQIVWPQARQGGQINSAYSRLKEYCHSAFDNATVLANPMWRLLPESLEQLVSQPLGPVLTVHPLGGCPMAENSLEGAVDEWGCVYDQGDATTGDNWFGSLVVLDGSIVPESLGANPSLTIAALALRATDELQNKWKLKKSGQIPNALGNRPIFATAKPAVSRIPQATEVEILERLSGHVNLQTTAHKTESFFIELTLAYKHVKLQRLMSLWGGRTLQVDPNKSCIRLFNSGMFDHDMQRFEYDVQRFSSDEEREQHLIWKAPLDGTLRFLHREESTQWVRVWRGLRAYLCNRGKRDAWQAAALGSKKLTGNVKRDPDEKKMGIWESIAKTMGDAFRAASRAGEVRRFDYTLKVGTPTAFLPTLQWGKLTHAMQAQELKGEKTLTYNRRANPWQQLTTLELTKFPLLVSGKSTELKLDTPFLARQGLPLMRLVQQQNHADALLDMASFGLFMTRVLINIHLWTFRKPDAAKKTKPKRLPGDIAGLPKPEITNLTVDTRTHKGAAAVVRLTRYRQPLARLAKVGPPPAPLVMIHGYSVSGNTFTHPTLKKSAAEYFWLHDRDVWVVDLRTSTGLATASLPWSIEEVALVDIPAALLHIKNATGQRVDLIAHCIGAAMTGMALLTDACDIDSGTVELGVDTWITKAQLGTLTAFNGVGGVGLPHPTVRSVVLSQKGPLLRYTSDNIFRAYMLRSLRRWLVPEGYRFQPRSNPTVSDQLIDRLLSSLPYPTADYDIENPAWPWQRTPWTASRHRMDALYARDFAAANLKSETLCAIDDLFGPINLDTVSQTIHFVRFSCVTNQAGRGEFVTLANLQKRWSGIPTLAIHGAGNGLVDVSTQTLLEENFVAAAVPFQKITYPTLEHQDVWIGKTSTQVFDDIESFLKAAAATADTTNATTPALAIGPMATDQWYFDAPWIGPRLTRGENGVEVHAMSSPRFGEAMLVLVPIKTKPGGIGFAPLSAGEKSNFGKSNSWLSVTIPCAKVSPEISPDGWLSVLAYPCDQTTLTESKNPARAIPISQTNQAARTTAPANDIFFSGSVKLLKKGFFELFAKQAPVIEIPHPPQQLLPLASARTQDTELAAWLDTLRLKDGSSLIAQSDMAKLCKPPSTTFQFLLGSCQYPAGLFDKPLAEKSLVAMAALTGSDADLKPDFVIFTGDQIYTDATGGLVDPTRSDERFDLPYEMALRTKPMRSIMRSVPVHMMLDDHEIIDNWEPPDQSDKDIGYSKTVKKQGLQAYWQYQRMDDVRAASPTRYLDSTSFNFDHSCASFYFLDTRSQRQYRWPGDVNSKSMFPIAQETALHAWLENSVGKVKFIVTPSIILPRRISALSSGADHVARCDAWDGYPGNMAALLDYIGLHQIQNVVFLSGDEHLSCVATATLTVTGKPPVQIASVHASGLYAPFPFSNAKLEDFVQGAEQFLVGSVTCSVDTQFAPRGDAFACITVMCAENNPKISVQLCMEGPALKVENIFQPPVKLTEI